MAYTRPWSVSIPAGTDSLAGAATDIRNLKQDFEERFEAVFGVGSLDADPIAVTSQDYSSFIHWSQFQTIIGVASMTTGSVYQWGVTSNNTTALTMYAPIKVPRGVTIKDLAILGQTHTSGSIIATLESVNTTSGVVQAVLATTTMGNNTPQSRVSGGAISVALSAVATDYIYYYIKLLVNPGAANLTWFQGVELVYTKPNLGVSI